MPTQRGISSFVIGDESTEFRLPAGAHGYATQTAQSVYRRVLIEGKAAASERPFLVELNGGPWAAMAETAVEDYLSTLVASLHAEPRSLVAKQMGPALCETPFASPLRLVLVGERPGDLLEHNYLLQNLCTPSRVPTTDWTHPGKAMREMTLLTHGGRDLVDFAASQKIRYIESDAGWYDDQGDEGSDASKINISAHVPNAALGYRELTAVEDLTVSVGRESFPTT